MSIKTDVVCRMYLNGVLGKTTPERRVVRTRKDGTQYVRGMFGNKPLTVGEDGRLGWEIRWHQVKEDSIRYPDPTRFV